MVCWKFWLGVCNGFVGPSGGGVFGPFCVNWGGGCVVEGDAVCMCDEVVAGEPVLHLDECVRKASRSGSHSVSCASEGECDVDVGFDEVLP